MNGKIVGIVLVLSGLIAGATLYYLQVYGYYREVIAPEVRLVSVATDAPEAIPADDLRAIDADSSPIRYRACFTTTYSLPLLSESYVLLDAQVPRNAPGWFDCFDAADIAKKLEAGTALAFLGEKNVRYGVDRIVVITQDGHGYAWQELNACGEKDYSGTVVGEDCPPRPEN